MAQSEDVTINNDYGGNNQNTNNGLAEERNISERHDSALSYYFDGYMFHALYNNRLLTDIIIINDKLKIHLHSSSFTYVEGVRDTYDNQQIQNMRIDGIDFSLVIDNEFGDIYFGSVQQDTSSIYDNYIVRLSSVPDLADSISYIVTKEYDSINQNENENENENDPPLNVINRLNNIPRTCFDPIEYNNVNISRNRTTFHILNSSDKVAFSACLDAASIYKYISDNAYLFYRCKETTPISSLSITRNSVHPEKYRMLGFQQRIYVKDKDIKSVITGKEYILTPIEPIGRLASHSVISGGNVVSALHCGPADGSMLYSIKQMRNTNGGKRYSTTIKKRKHHKKQRPTRRFRR